MSRKESTHWRPISKTKKNGRPAKLDDARIRKRLVELIAKGVPNIHACAAVDVSPPTFMAYREKHEWFREELTKAVGMGIDARLKKIEAASAAGDWRAAAWLLEHCQPEHFAKNRIEITGADGGPLTAGIGIYLPKKDNEHDPVIELAPAKQIENEGT